MIQSIKHRKIKRYKVLTYRLENVSTLPQVERVTFFKHVYLTGAP